MKLITPSEVKGEINAPPSKSMMLRAVAASALAEGVSRISNPAVCSDADAAVACVKALGADVKAGKGLVAITGRWDGENRQRVLDCGESGLCMRMFAPICATYEGSGKLLAHGSLLKRPVGMIAEPLEKLGAKCSTSRGFAPVVVKGRMKGGNASIDASESSQFLTGLLMALPCCQQDSKIMVKNLQSRPYVKMTLSLLSKYGISIGHNAALTRFSIRGRQHYRPVSYTVEGDWSGAAFLLVAGAIAGSVKVIGLDGKSLQADKEVLEALRKSGAKVAVGNDFVRAEKGDLCAFEFNATDCPDLFPALAVLACCCKGTSRLIGADRLRHKESDRAAAIASELGKLGAKIKVNGNVMEIEGGELHGGAVDSHGDHRMAMACAVAALACGKGVKIRNPECVSKSYPDFFRDLEKLKVKQ